MRRQVRHPRVPAPICPTIGYVEHRSSRVTTALHSRLMFRRRVQMLADNLAKIVPSGATSLLDVGCGDGTLARSLMNRRPKLYATGIEISIRSHTAIPVQEFDGRILPFPNYSHDIVMPVDVLHHAHDPLLLIREAKRVAAREVIIKAHLAGLRTWLSRERLRLMDWVGNIGHGVPLRYAYWSPDKWKTAFSTAELREIDRREQLELFGPMFRWLFERRFHFISRLVPEPR